MKSSVSVIIVNYNGAEYLDECIDSIQDRIPGLHEISLVDNASTDGSIDVGFTDFGRNTWLLISGSVGIDILESFPETMACGGSTGISME